MELGTHKITHEQYHSDLSAISNSQINEFERAPRAYHDKFILGNRDRDDTPALIFGRQFHELILEPEVFKNKYFTDKEIYDLYPDRTRKPFKDAMKEYSKQFEGKECIKSKDWVNLNGMLASLKNTIAENAMSIGDKEVTVCWIDPDTQLKCKAKIDYLAVWEIRDGPRKGEKIPIVLDVKTTMDASHRAFAKQIWNYKIYRQGKWYIDGATATTKIHFKKFGTIAIEKDAPYLYKFYEIPEWWLWAGDKEIRDILPKIQECKRTNIWPGLPNENKFEVAEVPDGFIRWFQETFPEEGM